MIKKILNENQESDREIVKWYAKFNAVTRKDVIEQQYPNENKLQEPEVLQSSDYN